MERLGEGWFRLVLTTFRSSSVEAGQRELLPAAIHICGSDSVRYGRYQFESSDAIDPAAPEPQRLVLRQEIHCGEIADATTTSPPTASEPGAQWRPSIEQEQLVESLTYAYFSARDQGEYRQAYALLSVSLQSTTTFERWRSQKEKFNASAGPVRARKIKKVTWYKDPPQALLPGLYAAVDFVSQFTNIDIHCGFVAWHQQQDGSFRVIREEENFIDREMQEKMAEPELATVRSRFGC